MAAGAAPLVPEAGLGALAIASALGFLVLFVALNLYRASISKILLWLAGKLDAVRIPIPLRGGIKLLGPVASFIRTVDRSIDHALAAGMLRTEKATVYLLHTMYNLARWTVKELADLSVTVEHALGLQRIADVPATVKALTAPLRATLAALRKSVAALDRHADALFGRARKGIDHVERIATRTIPRALSRIRARVGAIERTYASRKWWAKHWQAVIGTTAFATAVAAALSRLGLRWLRCSNVKKTGQAVCGMNADLLEDLLLGVATLTIGLNLRTFAEEMGEIVEDTAEYISNRVT